MKPDTYVSNALGHQLSVGGCDTLQGIELVSCLDTQQRLEARDDCDGEPGREDERIGNLRKVRRCELAKEAHY